MRNGAAHEELQPLLGWITLSAEGKPTPFFSVQLLALVSAKEVLAERTKEIHEMLATIGYFLIGLVSPPPAMSYNVELVRES